MSTATPPAPPPAPPKPIKQDPGGFGIPVWLSGGGFLTSLATTVLAFLMGGVVVAVTGSNPLTVYKGIFNGTGLNWFFPWVTGSDRENAAFNLQQTLLLTTTLIFVVAGGRLRLPLRPVQHRRPGPVDRRRDRLGVGGLLVRRHARPRAHRARDRAGGRSRAPCGPGSRASSRRPSAPTR